MQEVLQQKVPQQRVKRLSGKKIIVTGGSRGIGAAVVRGLALEGAKVAFSFISNSKSAESVLQSLDGDGHFCFAMNVADESSVEKGLSQAISSLGGLDGLVNNAGITRDQILLRMKSQEFEDVMNTNLKGTFLCTKAVLKPMLKSKKGSIVNITSIVGISGNIGQSNYAASKAGIIAFSKSVAQEMASRNIRINCIAPGFIETEMTQVLNNQNRQDFLAKIPLKTIGSGEDVAYAVVFLLSEEAKYITGHTLHVDGGLCMQ